MASASDIRAGRAFIELYVRSDRLVSGLDAMNRRVSSFGRGIQDMATKLLGVSALGAIPFLGSLKAISSVETELAKLRAAANPTAEEFKRLQQYIEKFGATPGIGQANLAAAMTELVKAGMPLANAMDGAGVAVVKFAKVAETSVADAAIVAADMSKVFGEDVATAMDILSQAADSSSVSLREVTLSMSMASAVAGMTHKGLRETATAIGIMGTAGLKGSDAGTALKTFFLRIAAPVDEGAKAIAQFGLNFRDAAGNLKPMSGIIDELQAKLGGLGSVAKDEALRRIFGTDAIRPAAILLAKGTKGWEEFSGRMRDGLPVGEKWAIVSDTLAGRMGKVVTVATNIGIAVGKSLAPYSRIAGDAFVLLGQSMVGWITNNQEAVITAAMVVAIVGATGAALWSAGMAARVAAVGFGGLAIAARAAMLPMLLLRGAAKLLSSAGGITSAVGGIASAVVRPFVDIAASIPAILGGAFRVAAGIAGMAWSAAAVLSRSAWMALSALGPAVGAIWTATAAVAGAAWAAVGPLVSAAWAASAAITGVIWAGAAAIVGPAWSAAATFAGFVWSGAAAVAGAVWSGAGSVLGPIWAGAAAVAQTSWVIAAAIAHAAWVGIPLLIGGGMAAAAVAIAAVLPDIARKAGGMFSGMSAQASGAFATAGNAVSSGLGSAIAWVSERASSLWGDMKQGFVNVTNDGTSAFRSIAESLRSGDIENAISVALAFVKLEWARVVSWVTGKWATLSNSWGEVTTDLAVGMVSALSTIKSAWADAVAWIQKTWDSFSVSSFTEKIAGVLAPVFAKIQGVSTEDARRVLTEDMTRGRAALPGKGAEIDAAAERYKAQARDEAKSRIADIERQNALRRPGLAGDTAAAEQALQDARDAFEESQLEAQRVAANRRIQSLFAGDQAVAAGGGLPGGGGSSLAPASAATIAAATAGTFNKSAASMMGGGGPQEQTARNTLRTVGLLVQGMEISRESKESLIRLNKLLVLQ
jgi:TP901 family phage tail tape measure protein